MTLLKYLLCARETNLVVSVLYIVVCIYYFQSPLAAKSLQSYLTLRDPIDSSPPGSPVPGILQARTLKWVAISFSNEALGERWSSQRDRAFYEDTEA